MKMKKILTVIALIFALNANAFALDGVAVIDIEKISKEAKVVKDIAKKIGKQRDKYQNEIKSKETKLEKEGEKIEAKKNILSQEALEKQKKEFMEKIQELKEFAAKRDKSLKDAYSESIKEVNEEVSQIVSKLAEEKGLSLVLPASQIVYALDNLDMTEEVIKKLDKKMSSVRVKFK